MNVVCALGMEAASFFVPFFSGQKRYSVQPDRLFGGNALK